MIRQGGNAMKRSHTGPLLLAGAVLLALMLVGWQAASAETPAPATPPAEETPEPTPTALLDALISATRTPMPTAEPDLIAEGIEQVAEATGLAGESFLGLTVENWINLGASILIVVLGYLVGRWLILSVLRRMVRRTETEVDDQLLKALGSGIAWLVAIIALNLATRRLVFVSAEVKTVLSDLYFLLGLFVVVRVVLRVIRLADKMVTERATQQGRRDELAPVIALLARVGRLVVVVIGLIIALSRLGIDVTAFAAALGVGGLALSLAAKDTIADAISGFIILTDRPFRIGDRIEIEKIGTWGDVVDIGLRTTRIRTRDNRMVIVPNSTIGSNQVINYSYPDPRYRIETHVRVGYGSEIEKVRNIIIDTVQHVEGVLQDMPVDALYIEMGDSAMVFRVRWWIESYVDTRRMFDRVHTALQQALDAAGIDLPFPTQTLDVRLTETA